MVKVLFDHNMPPSIARALHAVISVDGHEAHALRDLFEINISDEALYTQLGKENDWVVISKDVHQAKRRPEREAIRRAGVLAIFLAPSVEKLSIAQQAATILWQWDRILMQRKNNRDGLFKLPINKGSRFHSI